jgi:CRP/FNR family cyclic AMP-dependent transcriptional regulator
MNDQGLFDVVRASPFAVELTEDQCKTLVKIVEIRKLKDGEILLSEGHMDNSVHVVISGQLAVIKDSDGGGHENMHVLKSGEMAGAMGFIDGLEHSATLSSVGDTEIFSLSRDKFESLLKTDPLLVYRVMRSIIRGIHTIVRRMNNQYVQMTNYITKQRGRY